MSRKRENIKSRFLDKIKINECSNCWEWMAFKLPSGYGQFKMNGKQKLAHRASYEIFNGDIPEGMIVMHSCDYPSCVNPSHLSVGTYKENTADMHRKGRGYIPLGKGESNGRAKLTPKQVSEIRQRYANEHISQTKLSEEYRVSQVQISSIILMKAWSDL